MLFPEEDSPQLKAWIVKRLENTFVIASIPAASLTLDSKAKLTFGTQTGLMPMLMCLLTMCSPSCITTIPAKM